MVLLWIQEDLPRTLKPREGGIMTVAEELQNLNVLFDTDSQINMIPQQLAEEMRLEIEDCPLSFTAAAEEFKIMVKLVNERTNKVR